MSPFKLKEISLNEYGTWFHENFPIIRGRSPFHHPAWLSAVEKASRYRLRLVGVFDGQKIVAAAPGFLVRYGPFKLFGSPLRGTMTSCLGPIALNSNDHPYDLRSLIEACGSFARENWGALYSEFTLREPPVEIEQQLRSGWEHRRLTAYSMDLTQGQDAIWSRMRGRCRRHIRKAQQLGMRIVPIKDAHTYYQMVNDTYARRGVASWHSEHFLRAVIELVPSDVLWAWGVEHSGSVIAAGLFVHDDQEVYYLSGASLSEYRSLPTSYLLHWHVILTSLEAGLRIYDLGGRPTDNIDLFKKSFDPEVANYALVTHSSSQVRYAKNLVVASLPHLRQLKRWVSRVSDTFEAFRVHS